ncbi:hypothetical protein FGG08_007537 [Glutinoglossum americanum]|uniref:Uncharacterized protein n=1 Tax=Glutinoglossum americanum TaxID=1670608 RepID=A0A9P8HQK4_9PEZI|nr:hypothetical protein FGG08_007537 [Glutinoglossum americanum]
MFALSLELPKGTPVNKCILAASEIRLIHYPATSIETFECGLRKRCWPHSDFEIVTLLFQDQVSELELEDRNRPEGILRLDSQCAVKGLPEQYVKGAIT